MPDTDLIDRVVALARKGLSHRAIEDVLDRDGIQCSRSKVGRLLKRAEADGAKIVRKRRPDPRSKRPTPTPTPARIVEAAERAAAQAVDDDPMGERANIEAMRELLESLEAHMRQADKDGRTQDFVRCVETAHKLRMRMNQAIPEAPPTPEELRLAAELDPDNVELRRVARDQLQATVEQREDVVRTRVVEVRDGVAVLRERDDGALLVAPLGGSRYRVPELILPAPVNHIGPAARRGEIEARRALLEARAGR